MPEIKVLVDKCKKCGTCVQICPVPVFELKDKTCNLEVLMENLCIACGQCVSLCLQSAIVHSDFPTDKIIPLTQQNIPSYENTLELFRGRRSVRAYKDKPVEKEIIEKIINGGVLAPTAENFQSTEFLVIQNKDLLNKISDLTLEFVSGLTYRLKTKNDIKPLSEKEIHAVRGMDWIVKKQKEGRDIFLFNAPVLMVFHSATNVSLPEISVNLVLQNAALISHSLGMGGFYTGYVLSMMQNDKRIYNLLNIPENNRVYGAMTIGYPKYKYKNYIIRKSPLVEWR